jgi:nitric oxide dioxygenase
MALDVQVLEQSFNRVKPQAEAFAASFYDTLFTNYPAARPLFAETDMAAQQEKLIGSLVLVIDNLRQPEALSGALKGLGARHVQYGALPEHYPMVGQTLLQTLATYLGPEWTTETQQAWAGAYGVITELMLEGADYPPEVLKLELG